MDQSKLALDKLRQFQQVKLLDEIRQFLILRILQLSGFQESGKHSSGILAENKNLSLLLFVSQHYNSLKLNDIR